MAQTIKERKELETVMKSDPELTEILHQLSEQEQEDLVQVIITKPCRETVLELTTEYRDPEQLCSFEISFWGPCGP